MLWDIGILGPPTVNEMDQFAQEAGAIPGAVVDRIAGTNISDFDDELDQKATAICVASLEYGDGPEGLGFASSFYSAMFLDTTGLMGIAEGRTQEEIVYDGSRIAGVNELGFWDAQGRTLKGYAAGLGWYYGARGAVLQGKAAINSARQRLSGSLTKPQATIESFSNIVKGDLGEAAARRTLTRAGYNELPARLPGNQGFDGVYVRYAKNGAPIDLIITESKYSSTGRAYLTNTKTMGKQLSGQWVDANIEKLLDSNNSSLIETGRFLRKHKSLIRKKANVLDFREINRWNRINIPD